ncbi:MAG: hypothetical protein ACI9Y1_002172 [Lentisphaeria bacterium]|jgi:hypothetical protein
MNEFEAAGIGTIILKTRLGAKKMRKMLMCIGNIKKKGAAIRRSPYW